MDIFGILKEDADDVILIVNYFIETGERGESTDRGAAAAPAQAKAGKRELDDFWKYV